MLHVALRFFAAAAVAPVALGPVAPAPVAPPLPQPIETLCAAEGRCVWVSQRWLREQLQEAARGGYAAGKRDADIKCGRVL